MKIYVHQFLEEQNTLHLIADLLAENNLGKIPKGDQITCLDIGVGASCIYPIIGVTEYGWKFIGSDIDSKSLESAKKIALANPSIQR
jgi:23S rRNA (adenine1618-N6)-methyltransferase